MPSYRPREKSPNKAFWLEPPTGKAAVCATLQGLALQNFVGWCFGSGCGGGELVLPRLTWDDYCYKASAQTALAGYLALTPELAAL